MLFVVNGNCIPDHGGYNGRFLGPSYYYLFFLFHVVELLYLFFFSFKIFKRESVFFKLKKKKKAFNEIQL